MKKIDTNKLINAETVLSSKYGVPGSDSRRMFEEKAHAYYYGVILRDRRKELKMTQSELAEKQGRHGVILLASNVEKQTCSCPVFCG